MGWIGYFPPVSFDFGQLNGNLLQSVEGFLKIPKEARKPEKFVEVRG